MKKQNKIIITSLILMFIFGSILVYAGEGDIFSSFTKSETMDKSARDYLLTKLPEVPNGEVKEIKPIITINCDANTCKYSVVQEGIINSYDNVISKYRREITSNSTESKQVEMNTKEIETLVAKQVNERLTNYANNKLNEISYTKISEGTLEIIEK